jgi:hypothetical protein
VSINLPHQTKSHGWCCSFKNQSQPFMRKIITMILAGSILLFSAVKLKAQATRPDKLYTMSGIGMSLPVGESADYLRPKISTSLGLNLGLGNSGLFLYPKVSLHVFAYDGITPDESFTYTVQNARSSTYLLNLALGCRKITGKFAFYGFAGGGGGLILTPTASVNATNMQVNMDNTSHGMGIIEVGGGTEYNIGGASLFIEASYMNGFNKIQNRNFTNVPIAIGIKPNLSKLFNKK